MFSILANVFCTMSRFKIMCHENSMYLKLIETRKWGSSRNYWLPEKGRWALCNTFVHSQSKWWIFLCSPSEKTCHKGILTQQWWKLWQTSASSRKSFSSVATSVAKKSVKEIFTPSQFFASKKAVINNDTYQDVEPLL